MGNFIPNRTEDDSQDIVGNILRNASKAIKSNEKKMTPAEKIASVHIDFTKDNVLPELNEDTLTELGIKENKSVLVKKTVINRNQDRHGDVRLEDANVILGNALYSPDLIVPGKNKSNSYFSFAKSMRVSERNGKAIYGVVLLDVEDGKENFEVVHWHWLRMDDLKSL